MKSIIFSMITAAGLMVASSVMAADVPIPADRLAFIKKNGLLCHTCHKIEGVLIGPAWMDVSKKYKGEKTYVFGGEGYKDFKGKPHPAEELPLVEGLMKKVSNGGNGGGIGHWPMKAPMLANDPTGKKQEAIKEMVQFVLGLAK